MAEKFISENNGEGSSSGIDFEAGNGPSELVYTVFNAADMADAIAYALTRIGQEIPATFMGLPCMGFNDCREDEAGNYRFYANYRTPTPAGGSAIVSETYTFSTTGGSAHIFNSKSTRGKFAAAGATAPDFKGAINVTQSGVEGADIDVSRYDFSITRTYGGGEITDALISTIRNCSGKTNSLTVFNALPEEIYFHGATGERFPDKSGTITFNYSWQPQIKNLSIGGITATTDKGGWDLVWVLYEDVADTAAKFPVKRPKAFYFEVVFDTADLKLMGFT